MPRILMTGAAGGIGASLRKLLPPIYPDLLLSDLKTPAALGSGEKFKAADLADLAQVEACAQAAQFGFGLDAFGGDGDAETLAEADDRADDRLGVGVGAEIAHEGLVDLDLVEREAA